MKFEICTSISHNLAKEQQHIVNIITVILMMLIQIYDRKTFEIILHTVFHLSTCYSDYGICKQIKEGIKTPTLIRQEVSSLVSPNHYVFLMIFEPHVIRCSTERRLGNHRMPLR